MIHNSLQFSELKKPYFAELSGIRIQTPRRQIVILRHGDRNFKNCLKQYTQFKTGKHAGSWQQDKDQDGHPVGV